MQNNFGHLAKLNNIDYSIGKNETQLIKLLHPNNFVIIITIPNNCLEWFIDIYDHKNNKLVSDWDEHYGDKKDILILERQESIESYIHNLQQYQLRFIKVRKRFREISTIQTLKEGNWSELISNSKWKLV